MNSVLNTPIEYLKGVGPTRGGVLRAELSIYTYQDLLYHFPFRYIDRSQIYNISDIPDENSLIQLKGIITSVQEAGTGRQKRLVANLKDDTGEMQLLWFKGIPWIKKNIQPGYMYLVFGKPGLYKHTYNMIHPDVELISSNLNIANRGLEAVYSSTEKLGKEGLHSKGIARLVRTVLEQTSGLIPDTLPASLRNEYRLPSLGEALHKVHVPNDMQEVAKAQTRIKFEELFYLQLQLIATHQYNKRNFKGHVFSKVGNYFNTFYREHMPFELTNAQKRVIKEIRADVGSGRQMNRLLQGDVGSGKTMVAMLCMLLAIDNGFQTVMMAPTEILATQHYQSISQMLDSIGVRVELLTGSTKKATRTMIHQQLLDGTLKVLVGTHAVLEDPVVFNNLGIAVIDEQHRFGVEQRAKLWKKNALPPHILVMTATPIPRTLAMTLYGDLDVSVIDELPPGRKPIKTELKFENSRLKVLGFIKNQIGQGRQVYVVYPLIEESEALDMASLTEGYEAMVRYFQPPEYRVSVVHGKMKPADKDMEMERFYKGETHIMVATTVIEVGVNVPNASVMLIENAERFGLSQLHQLRGRVGRGADQSFCILMSGYKLSTEGRERLNVMCETQDGFKIAEEDLKLRGPGDIMGTKQSGILDLKLANIVQDCKMLQVARTKAMQYLEQDPDLALPEHAEMKTKLNELLRKKAKYLRVS